MVILQEESVSEIHFQRRVDSLSKQWETILSTYESWFAIGELAEKVDTNCDVNMCSELSGRVMKSLKSSSFSIPLRLA